MSAAAILTPPNRAKLVEKCRGSLRRCVCMIISGLCCFVLLVSTDLFYFSLDEFGYGSRYFGVVKPSYYREAVGLVRVVCRLSVLL